MEQLPQEIQHLWGKKLQLCRCIDGGAGVFFFKHTVFVVFGVLLSLNPFTLCSDEGS